MKNLLILGVLFLSGCASQQKFTSVMDEYVNKSEDTLTDHYGGPDRYYQTESKAVLTYLFEQYRKIYSLNGNKSVMPASDCEVSFIIRNGIIRNYAIKGSSCAAE